MSKKRLPDKAFLKALVNEADLDCPECGAKMKLRNSKYGPFYGCSRFPDCRAAHGAHGDGRPLGIPANKETKEARIRAHDAFDGMWKNGKMSRRMAYQNLRHIMRMTKEEAHIGKFTKEQCEELIEKLKNLRW